MKLLPVLLLAVVFIAGCTATTEDMMKKNGTMQKTITSGESINNSMMNDTMMSDKMMKGAYTGAVLAGTSAPLLDFRKVDYDKALQSNKTILLYFFANWCPICRAELPHLYAAFNELNTDKVIGFRVNYNDGDTDADELALAQQFQVPYQHSKVFVKNAKSAGKFPGGWDKIRYLLEINKAIA